MPNGTITSTENTFGTVNGALSGTVAGTLTGSVGVPGPQGSQGPQGIQGPPGPPGVGGTWGSITGTLSAQTDLQTVLDGKYSTTNPSGFITSSALAPYLTSSTASATYQTLAGMSAYLTTSAAAAGYYPLSGNPSGFLTSASLAGYATQTFVTSQGYITASALTPYLTSANAALTYAPIAAGLPTGGTVGQVLTKNSGSNFDTSFQTLIPGDRYLTTSTTSNTIGNGTKTFTVGTGLSYSSQQDVVISYNASNHMHAVVTSYNSGTGVLVVDVNHHTGSGTYTAWTVNVGGMVPLQSVEWGEILGVIGDQSDLAGALNSKLESSTAASTYAPIASPTFTGTVTIPAGASISGFAPLASPSLTGNVSITSNSTGAALFIEQAGTGNILTLHDQATDTSFVAIDQNGKVSTIPATTAGAGFNVAHGTAPTTFVDGDIWTTTGGFFWRQNAATKQAMNLGDTQTVSGNITFSNASGTFGSSTAAGTINIGTGATVSGSTKAVNIGTAGASGSTTNVIIGSSVAGAGCNVTVNGVFTTTGGTQTINNGTGATTTNIATGATLTATTKAVNIGTSGVAGSTTNIAIGSTTGTSTTTLQGTTNGVTAAVDTNSVALATTAFVVGQAGSATPLVDGTAAVGTSLRYARQDHVHPTDTSRAALASPTFTGTPAAPTAAVDTNTTQLATTAFVVAQAAAATPLVDGTAAVGTSLRYARQDHVHPTDTTRAPLASPALTGTPTAPTATAGTNTTQIATTAFVQAAVPAIASVAQTNSPSSNTVAMSPDKVRQMMMFPGMQTFLGGGSTGTSGAGAIAPSNSARHRQFVGPNASTAGYSAFVFDTFVSQLGFLGSKRGVNEFGKNYARPFWASGRTIIGLDSGTFTGDVNNTFRCELGGRNVLGQSGDPTGPSLGWRVSGGGASAIVFYMRSRSSVNGGTYSQTTTSFTPTANQWFDWMVTYNGTDTCQMYVNDTLVGTISANFTGFQGEMFNFYTEQIEQTASAAVRMGVSQLPPRIFFSE